MDYGKIINRAWQLTRRYRFLWWLGILAFFTEGTTGLNLSSFKTGGNNNSIPTQPPSNPTAPALDTASAIRKIPRVLGTSQENIALDRFINSLSNWFTENWPYLVGALLILFILFIILLYYSYSAKAGLILSVNTLEQSNKALNFSPALKRGKKFIWRLFGLHLLIGLLAALAFFALLMPVIIIYVSNQSTAAIVISVIYGIIALLLFILLIVYLTLIQKFAERTLVLDDRRIIDSFQHGSHLFHSQFKHIIIGWLIQIALGIAVSFCLFIIMFIVLIILLAIGYGIYLAAHNIGLIIYISITSLAIITVTLIINGIVTAFFSTYWTLTYRAINYLDANELSTNTASNE